MNAQEGAWACSLKDNMKIGVYAFIDGLIYTD
jgi:hypothetical protein